MHDNLPHVVWQYATLSNEHLILFYSILLYSTQMNSWFRVWQLPPCCVTICHTFKWKCNDILFYFTLFYPNEQLVLCVTTSHMLCDNIYHTFKWTLNSILFYFTLFYTNEQLVSCVTTYPMLCDHMPHFQINFSFILFYSIQFYSILFYSILLYYILPKLTVGFVCDNFPHVVWQYATLSN